MLLNLKSEMNNQPQLFVSKHQLKNQDIKYKKINTSTRKINKPISFATLECTSCTM